MAKDIFPLGFHAGVGGYFPADLIRTINRRGLRAFVKVVDDDGRANEALKIGRDHGVENVVVYRISKWGKGAGVEVDAPQMAENPTPADWWQRHISRIYSGLDPQVWLELSNETENGTYAWQGKLFYQVARDFALPAGRRICVPGSNSGEPESWNGWEDYLRLAADQPDKVAISVHFYAWGVGAQAGENWDTYYPDHIGRESRIYAVCDRIGVAYPTIHITEAGFAHDRVPDWSPVVDDYMKKMARYVAERPNMTGAALWCVQPYQNNVHEQFNSKHMPQLVRMAEAWAAPGEIDLGQGRAGTGKTGGTGKTDGAGKTGGSDTGDTGTSGARPAPHRRPGRTPLVSLPAFTPTASWCATATPSRSTNSSGLTFPSEPQRQ